MNVALSSFIID